MEISFVGKRALVSGSAQGIGRAIAIQLAKCGAKVVAVDQRAEVLETLKKDIPDVEIVACDLSNWKKTESALQNVFPIDLLVNNAGYLFLAELPDVTEENLDKTFDVNVKAVIHLSQMVAKDLMNRKAPGSIVNISSQASMIGLPLRHGYCASKGAVDGFTRAAALELGPQNIRINCVNPTVIMTDMGRFGWSDPARANPFLQRIPLRRFGEVEEVVNAVAFLLSDKASLITGTCMRVDGGYTAV